MHPDTIILLHNLEDVLRDNFILGNKIIIKILLESLPVATSYETKRKICEAIVNIMCNDMTEYLLKK